MSPDTDAKRVLVIGGPTASGKSAHALAVAEAQNGVIINADSMQMYAVLPILTAQPSAADRARVPHRLYGVLPPSAIGSVARWRALAVAEIHAAHAAGQVPVVVGGTGMYLKALIDGLAPVPAIPPEIRQAAQAQYDAHGGIAFRDALLARDPGVARWPAGDRYRLIRAWEVLEATGRSLTDWHAAPHERPPADWSFHITVLSPSRDALYAHCNARFHAMITAGALEDVRRFAALSPEPQWPVTRALGVAELSQYLAGRMSLEDAIAAAQQATRRYAKRQITWFRHSLPASFGPLVV